MRDMDDSFYDDPHDFMLEPTPSRGAEELQVLGSLIDAFQDCQLFHEPTPRDRSWNDLWLAVVGVVSNRLGATLDRYDLPMELGDDESADAARARALTIGALSSRLMS
jgi:hypothetical protein